MNLSVGIVGLPNVGKSTLFNAMLRKQVALAANYPFATIEPNVGVVEVKDKRVDNLAALVEQQENLKPGSVPRRYATIEFVDIAGLVAGASQGEGLGNQFLAHIREVDLICHVLRSFEDSDVVVTGKLDPKDDLQTVRTELMLKDLETLQKQGKAKVKDLKEKQLMESVIAKAEAALNNNQMLATVGFTEDEMEIMKPLCLLTIKPEVYVVNVSEEQLLTKPEKELAAKLQVPENNIMVICAKLEAELAQLGESEQKEYLEQLGLEESGIEQMAQVSYRVLNLLSFLTSGVIEARAWTVTQGTKAPQAAGVIHTDFIKHFIKAQVVGYDQFIELGGWKNCKEKGKVRQEGKDYVMQDGDVVEFMIGK